MLKSKKLTPFSLLQSSELPTFVKKKKYMLQPRRDGHLRCYQVNSLMLLTPKGKMSRCCVNEWLLNMSVE